VLTYGGLYNFVRIAQFALYQYDKLCEGSKEAQQIFIDQAKYLISAQGEDGGYRYLQPNRTYSANSGWLSGMAQGEAASVLLRAWALTGNEDYKIAALAALGPLRRDILAGGASYIRDGRVFFEEVAVPAFCHILNGHIYAAFGVWEACQSGIADEKLANLHNSAVKTLEEWLGHFDADGWSYYNLGIDDWGVRPLASLWYHQGHVAQLEVYSAMVGSRIFGDTARRWASALHDPGAHSRVWRHGFYLLGRSALKRVRLATPIVYRFADAT